MEGVSLDDVVTLLEVRRRFEVPSSICPARAHGIARTAQRMISVTKSTRRKTTCPYSRSLKLAKSLLWRGRVAPSHRIRKVAVVDAAVSPERKAHDEVELVSPCKGKSVIHIEIHSQSPNGATHRKKYDTPPLEGYCRGTLVPRCELCQSSELIENQVPYREPANLEEIMLHKAKHVRTV
jgi:hypothetical protein